MIGHLVANAKKELCYVAVDPDEAINAFMFDKGTCLFSAVLEDGRVETMTDPILNPNLCEALLRDNADVLVVRFTDEDPLVPSFEKLVPLSVQ